MKGIAISAVSTLLLLISIASVSILYVHMNRISTGAQSDSRDVVDAQIAPKFLAITCLDDYGYVSVSSDEPLRGGVFYTVKYGFDEVSTGFSDVNITDVGKVYFNASMTRGKEYSVEIRARHWSLKEDCLSVRDPGLVLYLPFNESGGDTARDWSLNGNDASVNASWVNGTKDNALRFDGLKQKATVPGTTGFDSEKFTLAFWALREYTSSDNEAFVEGGSFAARSMSNGNTRFQLSGGNSVDLAMANDTWVHYIMRYDGSKLSVFENCTLRSSINSPYSPSSGDLVLGQGPTEYLAGSIDEVYFFSRALKDKEMPMFCDPLQEVQGDAYNGTWFIEDGYCPPEDPNDPDCIVI